MVVITGGGTGGHLAIARSFCKQLNELNRSCIFIGSTSGQDKMWFENDENFAARYFLQSSGVVNKQGLAKIFSLFNIIKSALKCREIFRQNGVKAVISVGGYSAAPAALAALFCKIPLFIHEQNAKIGRLNELLRPFAKGFYSSYEKPFWAYPVGNKFFDRQKERVELKTILFLGGSQGAKAINELAIKLATTLKEKQIKIIHQCGKNSLENLRLEYKNIGFKESELELFDFSSEIEKKMYDADLCISRAGASSLWELSANALPCIFVPYPHAAGNHQFHNAKFLLDRNLCQISLQKDGEADVDEILKLIQNYEINRVSKGLMQVLSKDKTSDIIREILSTL
ncbi:UDP-N-acetylglucosamine--N-acetylmuramyl-(pentapeptide) pyrophosphoryl-undecaprenol N-acetylglucosamine transferase [Campylobacter suis]|uniref:UDP-N-acetylglucosamine--N-acetylmuramyl-(pentapeptide) pyrophosphoryl-undecaprenol N-acetylglucosamine transferase n=1 Tax=Campylobacter suis TaxID=2790657 RepID=A0ABM8Q2P6_9BACT|nr:UDP-N-acetylglucosamine--N-acetylmuramyl-(pentapeptide) pyrophosphoryl-undecaprenol N-acetylglucosamine transferase [Campylobacter suis]CAD7287071.1 UDP-N-acetylglucosamine--N-acetylmuramyl-(pentapeptide) pyrophosphoryl-undecaprenol N-acetylglucosamine transferase [Campylobacter suis]